ncbi:MAG TPA: M23 family metallopeptidase [bacterium]|nr:M23 family metallopeptidase [bacterium]
MQYFRKLFIFLVLFSGLGLGCAPQRPTPQAADRWDLPKTEDSRPRPRPPWTFADFVVQDLDFPFLPSIWPTQGSVTSDYGMRLSPIHREKKFHGGLDIAAPVGSPIFATADAVVSFSGYQGGYGRVLILDHGLGLATLYAHASKVFAKKGDRVRQGQIIAAVGKSGDTTGPHLHYEVRVQGLSQDPRPYGLADDH